MQAETGPIKRVDYIKIDIEGAECSAFKGMTNYIQGAKQIIGLNMELGGQRNTTKECCPTWIAPGGIFDVLHARHRLCPSMSDADRSKPRQEHTPRREQPFSLETVCASTLWDLIWEPCNN